MRFKIHIFKIYFAALWLSAILSGAFSFALLTPPISASAEMIYCPLTRRLQPANPPKNDLPAYSLKDICAGEFQKNNFAAAILTTAKIKSFNVAQTNFENLAFDFWQNGKSVLDNLPDQPDFPEKILVGNSLAAVSSSGDFRSEIFWKTSETFVFQLKPRPPTKQFSPAFEFTTPPQFDSRSPQIAPRAPPVSI